MKRDTTGKFVSNWDSEPKHRYSVSLTSTAWRSLDEEAHKQGISRSELIEHFARHLGSEQNLTDEVISVNAGNAEQQPILATVFNQDINNHQQLQLVTSPETECQVTTILESITDAFVAFDENWHYTYVNQAAVKILHKTPVELIGKHVWDEVFPELVGGVAYQELHRAVAEQVAVSWEEFGESVQCCL